MTMQLHEEHADGEVVEETDPVTATIRHNMTQERQQADRYAKDAAVHRQQANHLEDLAMECRRREERWRHLLNMAGGDSLLGDLDDQGNVQTVLFPRQRARYPLVHLDGSDTPHIACVGCGKPLREATAAEAEAVAGGRQIAPHRCDACTTGGNPYPPAA